MRLPLPLLRLPPRARGAPVRAAPRSRFPPSLFLPSFPPSSPASPGEAAAPGGAGGKAGPGRGLSPDFPPLKSPRSRRAAAARAQRAGCAQGGGPGRCPRGTGARPRLLRAQRFVAFIFNFPPFSFLFIVVVVLQPPSASAAMRKPNTDSALGAPPPSCLASLSLYFFEEIKRQTESALVLARGLFACLRGGLAKQTWLHA